MENPERDVIPIIHALCTAPPSKQKETVLKYFTPTASFTHPFCRTGSFASSRWIILQIYRWYKILSPHIDVTIDSVSFDKRNLLLYVGIRQNFRLWVVPGHCADVRLVTVLSLTTDPYPHIHESDYRRERNVFARGNKEDIELKSEAQRGLIEAAGGKVEGDLVTDSEGSSYDQHDHGNKLYYIQSQNDLYQTSEFIKFVVPWGIGSGLVMLWHFWNTFLCVIGAIVLAPISWLLEYVLGGNNERVRSGEVFGQD